MIRVLQSVSCAGAKTNEDLIWYDGETILLLDGATSLIPTALDGSWFVHSFAEAFRGHPGERLDQRVNHALAEVTDLYRQQQSEDDPKYYPSAGGVIAQLRGSTLEILAVGDCTGLVFLRSGELLTLTDEAIRALDQQVFDLCKTLHETTGRTNAELMRSEEVRAALLKNRQKMNRPDGYRILSMETSPFTEDDVTRIPADAVRRIVCFSDGFDALAEELRQPELSLAALYTQLRHMEADDPDFEQYPRFKPGDDASALVAELDAPNRAQTQSAE